MTQPAMTGTIQCLRWLFSIFTLARFNSTQWMLMCFARPIATSRPFFYTWSSFLSSFFSFI